MSSFTTVGEASSGDSQQAAGLRNTTLGEAARTFAQALIAGDSHVLKQMSRGTRLGYPTGYVMRTFGNRYSNRDLAELTFDVNESENRVRICSGDGDLGDSVKFKRFGDRYFFSHYDHY